MMTHRGERIGSRAATPYAATDPQSWAISTALSSPPSAPWRAITSAARVLVLILAVRPNLSRALPAHERGDRPGSRHWLVREEITISPRRVRKAVQAQRQRPLASLEVVESQPMRRHCAYLKFWHGAFSRPEVGCLRFICRMHCYNERIRDIGGSGFKRASVRLMRR
jgi:hypothetical protein